MEGGKKDPGVVASDSFKAEVIRFFSNSTYSTALLASHKRAGWSDLKRDEVSESCKEERASWGLLANSCQGR
jgi:hypothetical protein